MILREKLHSADKVIDHAEIEGSGSAARVIPETPRGVAVETHAATTIGNRGGLCPIRPELRVLSIRPVVSGPDNLAH